MAISVSNSILHLVEKPRFGGVFYCLISYSTRHKKSRTKPGFFRVRAAPVKTESVEPLYPFVFTHYPTQNRFALLLEML
ncbi:hypothetical protein FIB18_17580 [Brucella pecoris]|uniref:Uncharacterized protein n=1 Tax=Brucella pecoris TaxID=867683 RepID=A0A5C5CFX0_9HYPH|nr:hypothetical protein FIB18_17580 [Brucella pecoris]